MTRFSAVVLLLVGLMAGATPGLVRADQSAYPGTSEANLIEHGHYVNSSGQVVHSPAHTVTGTAPGGATAQCRDGSYSFSQHRSGTCSRHGGVAQWL